MLTICSNLPWFLPLAGLSTRVQTHLSCNVSEKSGTMMSKRGLGTLLRLLLFVKRNDLSRVLRARRWLMEFGCTSTLYNDSINISPYSLSLSQREDRVPSRKLPIHFIWRQCFAMVSVATILRRSLRHTNGLPSTFTILIKPHFLITTDSRSPLSDPFSSIPSKGFSCC